MEPFNFYFKGQTPTHLMIERMLKNEGWQKNIDNPMFSQENLDVSETISNAFEFKHLLHEYVSRHYLSLMPATHYIDDANYLDVCYQIERQQGPWILKPSMINNGEGIRIFKDSGELRQHYLQSKRLSGPHVLQLYIAPHLLNGHKYSLRMFVVLSEEQGAFLYPEGYFNVCKQPYQKDDFSQLASHLSNEHFGFDDISNTHQIPSHRCDFFSPVFDDIFKICQKVINAYYFEGILPLKSNNSKLVILGFDFMLDVALKTYLLEINHGACFATDKQHPLYHPFYEPFFTKLVKCFILNSSEAISKAHFKMLKG